MKNAMYIIAPLISVAVICLVQSCKKTNDYPSRIVTISYPVVTLNGPSDTTLNRGTTWVDPGAIWKDTVTGESGTISFSINTSKDSAYYLVYIATNKNGFSNQYVGNGPPTRGVAVTNMNNNTDISGGYSVNNGLLGPAAANVAKVSRALFTVDNIDGFGDPGVLVIKSDSTVSIATITPTNYNFQVYVSSATLTEALAGVSIIYQPAFYYTGNPPHLTPQPAVSLSYTAIIPNVSPIPITLVENLQ